ncbi:hypothetical protein [Helicobacter suis]|uniref:hypothetical protein n=1 Tax=Helicobacter suis TaxID=104628 RepID=UPI0024906489|nr:hypothetical protein [Helicobacter suis]
MQISIFCDATPQSGLGHLKRMQKLKALLETMGAQTTLFASHSTDLPPDWHKASIHAKVVIIDSYLAPLSFYKTISSKLVVFEDMPQTYPPHVFVINPGYQAHTRYTTTAQQNPRYFLGIDFLPIDPLFISKNKALKPTLSKLFLSFGGSDLALSFYQKALNLLQKTPLEVHITAPLNIIQALQINYLQSPKYYYHANACFKDIAFLMQESDLALLAGGGMLYEAILSKTPIIAIPVAPNQQPQVQALSAQGSCHASSLEGLLESVQILSPLHNRERMQKDQEKLKIGHKLHKTMQEILTC